MANRSLKIGSRRSRLALAQTFWVQQRIAALGIPTEIVEIVSEGDRKLGQALYAIENAQPGLFTKELQRSLLEQTTDLAVHSLKDLPTQPTAGLQIAAISERAAIEDCLLLPRQLGGSKLEALPAGARVGTSSLRREAQLLAQKPDLAIVPIRGNVLSRIEALRRGDYQAIVLARAGLDRVGHDGLADLHLQSLDPEVFVPAPGQGALAVEGHDQLPLELLAQIRQAIHCPEAELATRIERTILRELEGGCTLPLGVWCQPQGQGWRVRTFLGEFEPTAGGRNWTRFRRFDISGEHEQVLVSETVNYFRNG